mmetsp:Transcript_12912/g.39729  ORF Transcript_12912/g.39729 Transcript_12912/m.39729 type:complete len:191 (+) Transcript_12912:96-668(+)
MGDPFEGELNTVRNVVRQHASSKSAGALSQALQQVSGTLRDGRSMVEIALRELTLHKVADGRLEEYMALLDAGIDLAERRAVDATTPYMMLEDITTSLPVSVIGEIFPRIEARVKQLSSSENFIKGKQIRLVLLRAFVEFMRRCSRINDNALRGRTLTLLSSAFPLSEKSGVNIRGAYNTTNTTEFARKE